MHIKMNKKYDPKPKEKRIHLPLRLPESLIKKIKAEAAARNLNISEIVEAAIKSVLDE